MERPNNFYNQYIEQMEVSSTPCTPSPTTSSTEFSEIQTISESIMSTSEQCKFKIFLKYFITLVCILKLLQEVLGNLR